MFLFYVIYSFVLVFALSRGTAMGYVTYFATNNPQQLGMIASLLSLGGFLGFYLFKYFKIKNNTSVFIYSQIGFILNTLFFIIYLYLSLKNNNYGNYLFWGLISFFYGFFISVETRVKNFMLKDFFNQNSFSKIVKYDFLILSFGKLLGFAIGFLITSFNSVYFLLIISNFFNILLVFYIYLIFIKKIPINNKFIYKIENFIFNLKDNFNKIDEKNNHKSINFSSTIILGILVGLFILPLGTQAITYSKMFGSNFYIYLLISSLGGIFFNIYIANKQIIYFGKKYLIFILLYFLTILGFLSKNNNLILISMFFYGGILYFFNSMAQTRMYVLSAKTNKNYADYYFPIYSLCNIIGAYLFGKILTINFNLTFIILGVSIFLFYYLYLKDNKNQLKLQ